MEFEGLEQVYEDELLSAASQAYEEEREQQELLVASQAYDDEEESLREKYAHMHSVDFTVDRLLEDEGFTVDYRFVLDDVPQSLHDFQQKKGHTSSRFAAPVSEEEILEKIEGTIPKATAKAQHGL